MSAAAPAWSPDGVYLAFTGFTPGDPAWGVYLMHAASGARRRLCDGRNPSFSPDGRTLLFDRDGSVWRRTLAEPDFPHASDRAEAAVDEGAFIQARVRFRYGASAGLAYLSSRPPIRNIRWGFSSSSATVRLSSRRVAPKDRMSP